MYTMNLTDEERAILEEALTRAIMLTDMWRVQPNVAMEYRQLYRKDIASYQKLMGRLLGDDPREKGVQDANIQ